MYPAVLTSARTSHSCTSQQFSLSDMSPTSGSSPARATSPRDFAASLPMPVALHSRNTSPEEFAAARAGLRESLRETNTKRLAPMSPMSPTSAAGNCKRPASEHVVEAHDTTHTTAHAAPHAAVADRGALPAPLSPLLASNPGTTVPGPMGLAKGLSLDTTHTAAHATAAALNDEQCPVTKPRQGTDLIATVALTPDCYRPYHGYVPDIESAVAAVAASASYEQCPVTKPRQGSDIAAGTDDRPFHGCVSEQCPLRIGPFGPKARPQKTPPPTKKRPRSALVACRCLRGLFE